MIVKILAIVQRRTNLYYISKIINLIGCSKSSLENIETFTIYLILDIIFHHHWKIVLSLCKIALKASTM